MLEAMGYLRGPVTGVYDEATAQAVKEFQRDQGLPAQGKMDMETTDAFNRRWMKYTRTADIQLTKAIEVLHELLREN
jgi:carboxyl-terminal processing protease